MENVPFPILKSHTLDPDVGSCHDGEHKQKHDECERLKVVCCHPLHSKQDGPQKLPLVSVEVSFEDVTKATIVWCPESGS